MEQFKVGDMVGLKGGGPVMTVEKVEGTNVTCQWFSKEGNLVWSTFDREMLRILKLDARYANFFLIKD